MGMFDECETLEQAVFQAIGAASVCWEDMTGTGVFQDAQAKQIADDLLGVIRQWMNDVATIGQSELSVPETVKAEDARCAQ